MNEFPDWQPAPNIRDAPDVYELENEALDPGGAVWSALREAADWEGRTLVDLGCGTGFWLARYAAGRGAAARVVGVEPDPALRARAVQRVDGAPDGADGTDGARIEVVAGSAEHIPLPDRSVDVVHARFAYFFGPGAEAGLTEVGRVLAAGGTLVAIDNDQGVGEFAHLLRNTGLALAGRDTGEVAAWWRDRGATQRTVVSEWRCRSPGELRAVLANEFRGGEADAWLAAHPDRAHITYGFALFVWRAER